jgi:hypothetical protein
MGFKYGVTMQTKLNWFRGERSGSVLTSYTEEMENHKTFYLKTLEWTHRLEYFGVDGNIMFKSVLNRM